jgi:hypothetical protein
MSAFEEEPRPAENTDPGGDCGVLRALSALNSNWPPDDIRAYLAANRDLVDAISTLNAEGIVHPDINLLPSEGCIDGRPGQPLGLVRPPADAKIDMDLTASKSPLQIPIIPLQGHKK